MTTSGIIGVLGQPWRADVTAWGAVEPWDGSAVLDWHVAADDRWHTPAEEVTVRQARLGGAPVFETRLRVPGGDATHRVWSVAGDGGRTVIEVANESPLPIACAFTRPDLLTTRPPAGVPIQGIDLAAATTVVLPIGHRTSVTVALAHDGGGRGQLPSGLPSAEATVRGWVALTERASRLVLPAGTELVVAARSDLLLAGLQTVADDPAGYLLALAELVRMGELRGDDLTAHMPDVAAAVADVAPRRGWDADAALDAAAVVLARGGERRALRDLHHLGGIRTGAGSVSETETDPAQTRQDAQMGEATGIRAVTAVERRLARGPVLFPDGIPPAWWGAELEAHGLVAGPASTLSFAVRWHGEHPAVLWQLDGDPVELRAPAVDPAWRTRERRGEALWRMSR